MDNSDYTYATGFTLTEVAGANTITHALGKTSGTDIESNGIESVVGKIIGINYDNFRYMRFMAFNWD